MTKGLKPAVNPPPVNQPASLFSLDLRAASLKHVELGLFLPFAREDHYSGIGNPACCIGTAERNLSHAILKLSVSERSLPLAKWH